MILKFLFVNKRGKKEKEMSKMRENCFLQFDNIWHQKHVMEDWGILTSCWCARSILTAVVTSIQQMPLSHHLLPSIKTNQKFGEHQVRP